MGNNPEKSGRTAVIALTRNGAGKARILTAALGRSEGEVTLFLDRRFHLEHDTQEVFDLPLRPLVQRLFAEYSNLVLFLSVGAAVRLLAPYLGTKQTDPAVVCVDDAGKFCVSLLSGHLGGADHLAERVAGILDAVPVVTSASHVSGTIAVDLLGREFGWRVEADSTSITRASAAMVNMRPVGVCQEAGETGWWPEERPLPSNVSTYGSLTDLAASPCDAALVITDRTCPPDRPLEELLADKPFVVYRPKSLVAGMGCRKGVPVEHLEALLTEAFEENGLSLDSLACIATAELKRSEPGLIQLSQRHGVPMHCYSAEELNSVFDDGQAAANPPTRSARAHGLIGVWGVSEPAALLASGADQLLVTRKKTDRATVAVARRPFGGANR